MPVSRRTAEGLSEEVAAVYARAEVRLLRMVAERLDAGTGTPRWMDEKLAELQMFRKRAAQVMAGATEEATGLVAGVIEGAYRRGTAAGEGELAGLGRNVKAPRLAEFAVEALVRAHQGMLEDLGPRVVRQVADDYRAAVVRAAGGVLTGAATRREDAQQALDELARKGLSGFTDARGRRWGLESYVDMATRTVTAQAAVQGHMDRLEDGGLSLFIVSTSSRECDLCARWEGKVLSRGPVDALQLNVLTGQLERVDVDGTVEQATRAGLFHPNCTHNLSGYVHGATRRGDATHDPAGYAEKQRQRALERHVRDWRRREAAAATPEAKRAAQAKIRAWQAELRRHTDATGLPRKYDRERFDTRQVARLPDGPLTETNLALLDDPVLERAMGDLMDRGDYGPRFEQLATELDRRDKERPHTPPTLPKRPDPVAEQEALRLMFERERAEAKLSQANREKARRRDPEKELREEYDTWVHTQWLRAERECRGNLLNQAGQAGRGRKFNELDLFTRKQRSLEWASDELKEWFSRPGNQRMSYPEFRSAFRDDKAAREAGQRLRNRGWESEYG